MKFWWDVVRFMICEDTWWYVIANLLAFGLYVLYAAMHSRVMRSDFRDTLEVMLDIPGDMPEAGCVYRLSHSKDAPLLCDAIVSAVEDRSGGAVVTFQNQLWERGSATPSHLPATFQMPVDEFRRLYRRKVV